MPAEEMLFVNEGPVVVRSLRCNVVCNEDPLCNVYADIRILILCKYFSKLEMNHDSNYENCFQSKNYSTDVNRYGTMKVTGSIKI